MNASKETVRKVKDIIHRGGMGRMSTDEWHFVQEFLAAAEKKLPSEAVYKRDRQRRTVTAK